MAVLYWLYDDSCVSPWQDGYIGWTDRWRLRLKAHRCDWIAPFYWRILFRGSRRKCIALEWKMRPAPGIGWNKSVGGKPSINFTDSVRHKMSLSARCRPPISEATREKLIAARTGRTNRSRPGPKSDAERAKISASLKGREFTVERRAKMAAAKIGNQNALGHRLSKAAKSQISLKKRGVPIHSDEHKRKLSARMKGNNYTKGKPWSAARRLAWLQSQEVSHADIF